MTLRQPGLITALSFERATGIEPATFSLGSARQIPVESTGYGPRDRRVTFAARAVLEAIAKGEDAEALADEMVAAVLGQEVVLLALAAREEGPHRWRRVIELAGVILAAERAGGAPGRGEGLTGV